MMIHYSLLTETSSDATMFTYRVCIDECDAVLNVFGQATCSVTMNRMYCICTAYTVHMHNINCSCKPGITIAWDFVMLICFESWTLHMQAGCYGFLI
jgi:hypothetical protein